MPDEKDYTDCDCKIDLSKPNLTPDELELIRKARRNMGLRELECNNPLRLLDPPVGGCHNYIQFGSIRLIHACDNPQRREEYLRQHK